MSLENLPNNLPVPTDDGAANHLTGSFIPDICLTASSGEKIQFTQLTGLTVIYVYPMTGKPDVALPDGWNEIPGARGCTPQSCSYRDHYAELKQYGAEVFGLGVQSSDDQLEAKERLHLPFELLSDTSLILKSEMKLPTFMIDGMEFYKRLSLIIYQGKILKVFYPIFPPDKNAEAVISWLESNTPLSC